MPQLSYDIISEITSYLPLAQVQCTARLLGSTVKESKNIYSTRTSYYNLFAKLVPNVEVLIKCMLDNNCWLFGSRAAQFFIPGSCLNGSDWNFLVDDYTRAIRVQATLTRLGTIWEEYDGKRKKFALDHVMELVTIRGSIVCAGVTSNVTITSCDANKLKHISRFITDKYNSLTTLVMLGHIAATHSTPVQCFISGDLAVHLDEKSSIAGKLIKNTYSTGTHYLRSVDDRMLQHRSNSTIDPHRLSMARLKNAIPHDECKLCIGPGSSRDKIISQEILAGYMKICKETNADIYKLKGREFSVALVDWLITNKYDLVVLPKNVDELYRKSILKNMVESSNKKCDCQRIFTQIEYKKYYDRGYTDIIERQHGKLSFVVCTTTEQYKDDKVHCIRKLEGSTCYILADKSNELSCFKAKTRSQLIGNFLIDVALKLPLFDKY